MQNIEDKLILSEQNLKNILTHIALCVECEVLNQNNILKTDLVELFKQELENQQWLNNLEDVKYKKIEIDFD
ncbi:MAG TPA: hypothetical protein VFC79_02140 [Tissierellaceae bacterium]|nr:hypothetical protein [Tissierellaceae bacterium]